MFMPEAVCDNSHSRQVKESTVQTEVLSSHPHHLPLGLLTVEGGGGLREGYLMGQEGECGKAR